MKLKSVELSQEPVSVDQTLSFEVKIVLATPAPTPTPTANSWEEIIQRPQSSKTFARARSSKEADDDEALSDDISEDLFFQGCKAVQETIKNSIIPMELE